jgi:hypothetical protein
MPRKTAAEKSANSASFYRGRISEAYKGGEIDAPLTEAMRWLYAALRRKAAESPSEAPGIYQHATEQIAIYADKLTIRTSDKK